MNYYHLVFGILAGVLFVFFILLYLVTRFLYFNRLDESQVEITNFQIPVGNINLNSYLIFPKFVLEEKERSQTDFKLPLIIVNHGWDMFYKLIQYWAIGFSIGGPYACLIYEVRGHGKSKGKKRMTVEMMEDVTRVIDHVFAMKDPRIDYSNVGFFGFSYGAICALTKGYSDPRVKAVVAMAGAHDVKACFSRKPESFKARIRLNGLIFSGLNHKKISEEDNKVMSPKYVIDPNNHEKNQNVLLIHGENDNCIPFSEFEKNAELLQSKPENLVRIPNTNHSLNSQELIAFSRALGFFRNKLKPTK